MKKWTTLKIRRAKGETKLACLTAGDFSMARLLDAAGIPLILAGDSLGMAMLGFSNTLPVTMEHMLHHTAAVARGAQNALVVADMPFMSYQVSEDEALRNAGRFVKEAGADAVKIEGGAFRAALVRRLVENGIPVLGHIGLTPQTVNELGGYRVQGRTEAQAEALIADAKALDAAGVFALVVECVPAELGARITKEISVPTIGIGAGPGCDGQVLVLHDFLGLTESPPKLAKAYLNMAEQIRGALARYTDEVGQGIFPGEAQCYR
jgi:3-methyl-2-oxobutanoate hydroxymethyltransferase